MTKLRPEQLSRSLTEPLPAIVLISGDEPLLVQEATDAVRKAAKTQGFAERDLYHADASFDWGQIASAGNSLSLFADKKIIELRLPSGKPGDKGSRALIEAAALPAEDNLLLIICGKLEKTALNSKWYKAVEAAGIHVAVWPVEPAQLPRWIGTRLKQAGLRADNSAIDLLASRIEGNLLAAAQEIEKLKLLSPDGNVSAELMASAVADSARYDVFGLTDKALAGDARGAIKSLHGL
ncbi:MAG TPA: DNA polymerase III subunit delta, partial [Marinobacter sp.]|nr:DNA polymerase III subunit delta [Marinobacter sp.]